MTNNNEQKFSVVMMGATGAVGSEVVRSLLKTDSLETLTLLGRRDLDWIADDRVAQHSIDIFKPQTYNTLLTGHQQAICTLGVGQPSTMSKEEFVRIDKDAVLEFATQCKAAGVTHFQLLSSVGTHAQSRSFFLRTKGELQDGLKSINFERLSLFQPSMILTEHNRYGFLQAVTLTMWPVIGKLFFGPLRKYRGIPVAELGQAIANNIKSGNSGVEILQWQAFKSLALAADLAS